MYKELECLPIKKKIGQLFFIGLPTTEINKDSYSLLEEISPGGICLFARNIRTSEQTHKLLNEIREVLEFNPLLAIDQEGGLVDRLRRLLTPMPSAAAIKSIKDAEKLALITAEVLRILSFNMNFAPVVDVASENTLGVSNGLYSRIFGDSKNSTLKLADAYLTTLQKNGCIGCLKHFPGLGASHSDSHENLPIVNLNREQLFANDLFVYQEILNHSKVPAVMVGHASYPQFDLQETDANGKLLPSSLSFQIINNLLREEMHYQSLVITDDLEMGAILKNYTIGEACVMAINAGVDMLLICASMDAIRQGFAGIVEAVKAGQLKESRIDKSLKRIAQTKSLIKPALPFDPNRLQILSQEINELNKDVNYNYGG